ncbi:MAG: hypothetical protein QXI01_03105 [Nitrososphaerota archaeon]
MPETCPDCGGRMKKHVASLTKSFALGISVKSLLPTELKKYNFLDILDMRELRARRHASTHNAGLMVTKTLNPPTAKTCHSDDESDQDERMIWILSSEPQYISVNDRSSL